MRTSSRVLIFNTFESFHRVKEAVHEEGRKAEHGGSVLQWKSIVPNYILSHSLIVGHISIYVYKLVLAASTLSKEQGTEICGGYSCMNMGDKNPHIKSFHTQRINSIWKKL